jgi:coenzyme F420 biosynthesis associated uncharacterized protein
MVRNGAGGSRGLIDWEFAIKLGAKAAGPGPRVGYGEAADIAAALRSDAARSSALVRDYTGLDAPEGTAPVLVVDRAGWVRGNVELFQVLLDPVVEKVGKRGKHSSSHPVGGKVTGAEIGGLLSFLAKKVLGQFDPFSAGAGRLLLVAPNIVHVQRELAADPADFRLWVCLHEETHRVQFTANPWLRDHIFGQVRELADSMEVSSLLEDGLDRVVDAVRGEGSVLDALSTPEQREIVDRLTGVMSLLEGHADVVMDGVGPQVIPTVERIRRGFERRRASTRSLDRFIRRLIGLDQKMAQYRDGAKFVRHVVDKVGMERFNAVFASAENLPSKDEIAAPDTWIARVL